MMVWRLHVGAIILRLIKLMKHIAGKRKKFWQNTDLKVYAIANHLVGQAVCDRIDERHKSILPDYIWGDGDPEGVRQRAAQEMINTAEAAKRLGVEYCYRIHRKPYLASYLLLSTSYTGND